MADRHQYRFVIDSTCTPETLPMARLAEYMAKVATLLGEKTYVHFVGLEAGSAILVQDVEFEAHTTVQQRIQAVNRNDGPPDATQAYDALNRLLVDDSASAALFRAAGRDVRGARVLEFPGTKQERESEYGPVKQASTLQGVVIRVGGERDPVPVHLQDGEVVHNCLAKRMLAKELARYIFDQPLRVSGSGRWFRDSRGLWSVDRFRIADFTELVDEPIGTVVTGLRRMAAKSPVPVDALGTLRELRRSGD